MPGSITFTQVDGDGESYFSNQQASPGPTFLYYGDRLGTNYPQPTINTIGNNGFYFDPNPGDRGVGIVFILESTPGSTIPGYGRYLYGTITTSANPMLAVLFQNSIGELYNGTGKGTLDGPSTLTITSVAASNGDPVSPPLISGPFPALQVIRPDFGSYPPPSDNSAIVFSADAPSGAFPRQINGSFFGDDNFLGTAPSTAFIITGVAASPNHISVTLSDTGVLTGDSLNPSKWVVTGGGNPVTVTAVSIAGSTVTLTTTDQTDGASYTLLVPQGIADFTTSNPCTGPFTWSFTGVGSFPTLVFARAIDARLLEIIFSKVVVQSEAVNPANYGITGGGGLTVSASSKLTDTIYHLVTSRQAPGQLYTVTASNIHDLFGNLI